MVRRLLISGVALAALCLVGSVPPCATAEVDNWIGKRAPDFSLRDLDGKPVRLADLVGKKVVWVNFWGLRCGPCVREMPALQKLYAKHASKGLIIVGINTDGVDAAYIKKQIADKADLKSAGITFPLAAEVPNEKGEQPVIEAYELEGAPLNVMIDKKGIVRFHHAGYEDGDEANYAKVLEKLLAE